MKTYPQNHTTKTAEMIKKESHVGNKKGSLLFVRKKHKDVLILSGKELDCLLNFSHEEEKKWKVVLQNFRTRIVSIYSKCQQYFVNMQQT